jgi:SepF-like predicted cell division protein (DUF552 family)
MRFHVETTYASWCFFNGGYLGVEKVQEDLRTPLDVVGEYLNTFRPDDWKERQRFWTAKGITEAEEEYAVEWAEAEEEGDTVDVMEEEEEGGDVVATDGEHEEYDDKENEVIAQRGEHFDEEC